MYTLQDIFLTFKNRDKVCFVYRTDVRRYHITYRDFYLSAVRLATYLKRQGVKKEDRVAVWAPNSPLWAQVFWACVYIGAVVVPIDFISGRQRADVILKSARPKVLFQSRFKPDRFRRDDILLENLSVQLVEIENIEELLSDADEGAVEKVADTDLVELVYTSGTTGNPKGVQLTHKNLIANIDQIKKHIYLDENYNFLSVLPLSHMFEQMGGFLVPLSVGAKIVYLQTLKPSALMSAFAQEDIYAVMIVPRLLQALGRSIKLKFSKPVLQNVFYFLRSISRKSPFDKRKKLFFFVHKKFGRNFKFFVSGGAALDEGTAHLWQDLGFKIIEGYGLSETSPVLTANPEDKPKIKSAGVPLEGVDIKIAGDGEILVKGDNVFTGYWENEQASRDAFTDDGYFKTGDIGEFDSDGYLYIKGRKKEVIVLPSGVNVYPDDIEEVLVRQQGVKECCVVGIDRGDGEEVCAVIVLEKGLKEEDAEKIIQETNKYLDTSSQITSFYIYPEAELPKTPTLKVRKFIVKQKITQKQSDASHAGDRLYEIIARVAGTSPDKISEDTCLYRDLHLSSIERLELINILEQEYRMDINEEDIDQTTTVGRLREIVELRRKLSSGIRFRFWTNSRVVKILRKYLGDKFHSFILSLFIDLHVKGLDKIKNLPQPVIFISNHLSYFDQPVILKSMPVDIRLNTATAAREEFFFPQTKNIIVKILTRFAYEYATVWGNVFMLPQVRGFRKSLQYMGKLADEGINILIFPEGERSRTGELLSFMPGLGLMVKELKIPVVPIRIRGLEKVFPRGAKWPKKGEVEVVYGDIMYFDKESPDDIVKICREKIEKM